MPRTTIRTVLVTMGVALGLTALGITPASAQDTVSSGDLDRQLFSTTVAPTASEARARAAVPQAVKQALLRMKTGTASEADRTTAAAFPELVDAFGGHDEFTSSTSAQVRRSVDNGRQPAAGAERASAVWCRAYTGTVTHKTGLGFTAYRWSHTIDVCYDGSRVTGVNYDIYDTPYLDIVWYDRGIDDQYRTSTGSWSLDSYKRGHVENCILKYGCIYDGYPAVGIRPKGNGTADWFGWRTT